MDSERILEAEESDKTIDLEPSEEVKISQPATLIDLDVNLQYKPQPRRLNAKERKRFVEWLIDNFQRFNAHNYKQLAKESIQEYRELTGKEIPMTWIYTILRCGISRDTQGNITFRRTDYTIDDFCTKPSITAKIRITE